MLKPISGGGAVQTSTGFFVTKDTQSVRHEVSLKQQVDHVRTGTCRPIKPMAAQSPQQWQARLISGPAAATQAVDDLERALLRCAPDARTPPAQHSLVSHAGDTGLQPSSRRPIWLSKLGRALNSTLSIPDAGNQKHNHAAAARLSPRVPNKLTKPNPAAQAIALQAAPGFGSLAAYQAALEALPPQQQRQRLAQEAGEVLAALKQAETAQGQPDTHYPVAHRQQRANASADGVATQDRLAQQQSPSVTMPHGRKRDALMAALPYPRRQAPAGRAVHATTVTSTLIGRLEHLLAQLGPASGAQAVSTATKLHQLQRQEIATAIDALPGFKVGTAPDQAPAAALLRSRLHHALQGLAEQPPQLNRHAMPSSLVADIFLGAIAEAAGGDLRNVPAAPRPSGFAALGHADADPLTAFCSDLAFQQRVLDIARALPGGMLAVEQLTGVTQPDKAQRVAMRVAALARDTLHAMGRPHQVPVRPQTSHQQQLEQALQAAQAVLEKGNYDDCSEAQRAAFNAVRNGFLLQPDAEDDQNLAHAQQRLDKFLGPWVERATSSPHERGPLLNKTPFGQQSIALSNLTSTMGYDTAERPMIRLDKTLHRVLRHLDACTEQIRPGSLSVDEAVELAALLVTRQKSLADASLRPGHITLDTDDHEALLTMLQGRLGRLVKPAVAGTTAGPLHRAVSSFFASQDGLGNPADALRATSFIARIGQRIDSRAGQQVAASKTALLKDAGIARDITTAGETEKIASLDDLYAFLRPKVQQLELRGKVKISSGGHMAASTKLLSWPVSIAKTMGMQVVAPVRGEIKASRARAAVFEIGFSTTGFEIFIGSEVRHAAALGAGAGVRAGYDSLLSSGAGVDKTISRDMANTEGIWLRLPRNGDDERTRDEAQALLQTLFSIDQPAAGADPETAGTPALLERLLARHPNLSVSVVDRYKEKNQHNELAASAALLNVKTGTGEASGRIALLNAGIKSERRQKRFEQQDRTGFMQLTRSNKFSGGIAYAQGGLASISGAFGVDEHTSAAPNLGNGFTYARQLVEQGIDTKLRYITRDGETNAVDSRIDFENLDFSNHLRHLDKEHRAWLQVGEQALFKVDPSNPNDMPPLNERMRVAGDWLESVLEQSREQAAGNARHVYSFSYAMLETAAATVDGLRAKRALAQRAGMPDRAKLIDQEIDAILQHRSSWQPWKITTSERTSEKIQTGVNTALALTWNTSIEGQRGTNSYPK